MESRQRDYMDWNLWKNGTPPIFNTKSMWLYTAGIVSLDNSKSTRVLGWINRRQKSRDGEREKETDREREREGSMRVIEWERWKEGWNPPESLDASHYPAALTIESDSLAAALYGKFAFSIREGGEG